MLKTVLLGTALAGAMLPAMAGAQTLSIELNKVEPGPEACRVSFIARNGLDADIDALGLEAVFFDEDGVVMKLLTLDLGTVPQDRPAVRQFALKGLDCASASAVLINGVNRCEGADIDVKSCSEALVISNKSELETLQ